MSLLKVMTLNIGNPSLQRVQKQIDWLETRDEDVFVLTETKLSQGCLYLEEYFGEVGSTLFDYGNEPKFHVFFPEISNRRFRSYDFKSIPNIIDRVLF